MKHHIRFSQGELYKMYESHWRESGCCMSKDIQKGCKISISFNFLKNVSVQEYTVVNYCNIHDESSPFWALSIIRIVCFIVHDELAIYKVKTVWLCLKWMIDHFLYCEIKEGKRRQVKRNITLTKQYHYHKICD